jgi:hypothetical protein
MGLLNRIKEAAQATSENKADFFYTKDGDKKRIRMLCEIDDGVEIIFHSSYERKINVPCQKHFGRKCEYCENVQSSDLKTKTKYAFPIYNQDEARQQIMLESAYKNFSPIMPLVEESEEEGTIIDRDYIVKHAGQTLSKTITVRGQKPSKMEQKLAPWTKAEIMEKIDKAYPCKVDLDIIPEKEDSELPF